MALYGSLMKPTEPATPSLVSRKHLARRILGVSERTVDNHVASGLIPAIKLGSRTLFDPNEVVAALKKASTPATPAAAQN